MIFQLPDNPYIFPDPHYGEADGLLAVGGDLSPERLVTAYSLGIFPWYGFKEREEILWWCPMDRFVIFPNEIHISHTMRQLMRREMYHVTVNNAFDDVIEACSTTDHRDHMEGAWLGRDMIEAYRQLFALGVATSVEVWDNDDMLVGGLYGVNIGKNFFGESMFSKVPNASKLALIHLALLLTDIAHDTNTSPGIIDCQFETAHLKSMGGRHITYDEYMKHLEDPVE